MKIHTLTNDLFKLFIRFQTIEALYTYYNKIGELLL